MCTQTCWIPIFVQNFQQTSFVDGGDFAYILDPNNVNPNFNSCYGVCKKTWKNNKMMLSVGRPSDSSGGPCPAVCGKFGFCCSRTGENWNPDLLTGCPDMMKRLAPNDHHTCMEFGSFSSKGE